MGSRSCRICSIIGPSDLPDQRRRKGSVDAWGRVDRDEGRGRDELKRGEKRERSALREDIEVSSEGNPIKGQAFHSPSRSPDPRTPLFSSRSTSSSPFSTSVMSPAPSSTSASFVSNETRSESSSNERPRCDRENLGARRGRLAGSERRALKQEGKEGREGRRERAHQFLRPCRPSNFFNGLEKQLTGI